MVRARWSPRPSPRPSPPRRAPCPPPAARRHRAYSWSPRTRTSLTTAPPCPASRRSRRYRRGAARPAPPAGAPPPRPAAPPDARPAAPGQSAVSTVPGCSADQHRLRMRARRLDRSPCGQLVQRRLRRPVAIPAAQAHCRRSTRPAPTAPPSRATRSRGISRSACFSTSAGPMAFSANCAASASGGHGLQRLLRPRPRPSPARPWPRSPDRTTRSSAPRRRRDDASSVTSRPSRDRDSPTTSPRAASAATSARANPARRPHHQCPHPASLHPPCT